jgi:hypothetical protein
MDDNDWLSRTVVVLLDHQLISNRSGSSIVVADFAASEASTFFDMIHTKQDYESLETQCLSLLICLSRSLSAHNVKMGLSVAHLPFTCSHHALDDTNARCCFRVGDHYLLLLPDLRSPTCQEHLTTCITTRK